MSSPPVSMNNTGMNTTGMTGVNPNSTGTNYNPNLTGFQSVSTPTQISLNTTHGGFFPGGNQGAVGPGVSNGSMAVGSATVGKQHDMASMAMWNKTVLTSFPTTMQYYETYTQAYGWTEKLKELAFLSDLFREIDQDRSGYIDKEEFTIFATNPTTKRIFASRFGFQPHQQSTIFSKISGGEEQISYFKWVTYLYALMKKTAGDKNRKEPTQEFLVFERDRREKEQKLKEAAQMKEWLSFKALPLPSKGMKQREERGKNSAGPSWLFKMYPANTTCAAPQFNLNAPTAAAAAAAAVPLVPLGTGSEANVTPVASASQQMGGAVTSSSSLLSQAGQQTVMSQAMGSQPPPRVSRHLRSIKTQQL